MTDDINEEARLRELAALTARLPREAPPPPEAWPAIRSQIERERIGGRRDVATWQRPAFLAAASLLLIATSSAVTAVALRRAPQPPTAAVMPAPGAPATSGVSTLAQFTGRENEYLRRVNGLVAIMESEDAKLAPETIAKVKESLAVIDSAILEARAALASDPANRELMQMLEATYEKKVDLLERTTAMGES